MLTPTTASTSVKAPCPIFGSCGGCQYQDIPYEEELVLKERILKELLMREAGLQEIVFEAITRSSECYHYRNRLDLTLRKRNNGERQMGFMLPGTQRLQEVTVCPIARREINDFLPTLKEEAVRKLPENYKVANLVVRVGDEGRVFWGGIGRRSLRMKEEDYFWTIVKGRKIFYALDTFFQANLSILQKIVAKIESLIAWGENTVFLDLYSGVGLFGISFADRAREVIMIESGCDSVKLAHYNVKYHGLDHVRILEGGNTSSGSSKRASRKILCGFDRSAAGRFGRFRYRDARESQGPRVAFLSFLFAGIACAGSEASGPCRVASP
jgi:23S rRNA (uracil1939-C5)-methyltransferase/tRNA (uracil-5-)-methyltransferase